MFSGSDYANVIAQGFQQSGLVGAYNAASVGSTGVQGLNYAVAGDGGANLAAASQSGIGGSALTSYGPWVALAAGIVEGISDIQAGKYTFADTISGEAFDKKFGDRFNDVIPYSGDLLGTMFESLLGNPGGLLSDTPLFDNAILDGINGFITSNSNNRVYSDLNDGQFGQSYFTDNGRHKEQIEAVDALTPILQAMSNVLGGTSLEGKVSASAKHGFEFSQDGQFDLRTTDANAFLDYMFDRMVEGADHLDDALADLLVSFDGTAEETLQYASAMTAVFEVANRAGEMSGALRELILDFEGSTEQTLAYATALMGMHEMVQSNPVEVALSNMEEAQRLASTTMMEAYRDQVSEVNSLIAAYDGSAESAVDLNYALTVSRQQAYEASIAIGQMAVSIGDLLQTQSQYFREAVMSEEELRAARETRRDGILYELSLLEQGGGDPEKVLKLVQEFADVNRKLFDTLTEEEQLVQVDTFDALTKEVDKVSQSILGTSIDELKVSQDEINQQIMKGITGATSELQSAADSMGGHVGRFGDWVRTLVNDGIRIEIGQGGEVNA